MNLKNYEGQLINYRYSCEYLKQICSNKANKYYRYNNYLTRGTLIATIVLSAVAFARKETIIKICFFNYDFINDTNKIQEITPIYDFIFNMIVLLILILSVVNLICKFQEKSTDYFHTVTTLSSLIREINSLLNIESDQDRFIAEFHTIKIKYDTIMDYLPSHTDNDFIKAKYNIKVKNEISELIKNESVWKIKIWFTKMHLGIFLEEKTKNVDSNEKR
ncbi:MAG: hypothetical protein PHO36_14240 [Parabacteroides sp.]|nr:hypothetical protein [Parabacteroides sp.]